jgi:AcrR family transcriptional regulator
MVNAKGAAMSTVSVPRREPVQARSRETVTRILDAAETIVDEAGVEAATTRTIADRAGVSYPSLYRFFGDRDEILDSLLARHATELDDHAAAAEQTWHFASAADLLDAELDLHIGYYRAHPSAARLWMGGRTSATVRDRVHARMKKLALRMHAALVTAELIPADTDPRAVHVLVEMADRAIEFAYRESGEFDEELLSIGRASLRACATWVASSAQ